jgi:hypothetical protein
MSGRFVQGSLGVAPVLAWKVGTFTIIGIILGVILAIYAIYYLIFKLGK